MKAIGADLLGRIEELNGQLSRMRVEYADHPELYAIYSQSVRYELDHLTSQAREVLGDAGAGADLWISLQGAAIGAGSGLVDAVVTFLNGFKIAARHAASAISGLDHTAGRFVREVEAATAFEIVGTAPGSLKIGLAFPSVSHGGMMPDDFFTADAFTAHGRSAVAQHKLAEETVNTLLLALHAADDAAALEEITTRLGAHGTLRVFYHARALFPRGVDRITFGGAAVQEARTFTSEVRDRLKGLGERLVQAERYVSGTGVVRMLDLDKRTLRLEFVHLTDGPGVGSLPAEYDAELELDDTLNRPAAFSGWLSYDTRGVPQRIRIDGMQSIETLEDVAGSASLRH